MYDYNNLNGGAFGSTETSYYVTDYAEKFVYPRLTAYSPESDGTGDPVFDRPLSSGVGGGGSNAHVSYYDTDDSLEGGCRGSDGGKRGGACVSDGVYPQVSTYIGPRDCGPHNNGGSRVCVATGESTVRLEADNDMR